ncbi:hypothetical protein ONZ45_g11336 [Pleurotus djamor]|nr:hypothetical protein ONZ45_g11336 [Pleurotus djamor]
MGYFDSSHDFTIEHSEMNDIAGDQIIHDHSTHNNWQNSNNTRNTNISDSYNDYSKRLTTNHNYFNHNGGGGTFNNVSGTQVNNSGSLSVNTLSDDGSPRSARHSMSINPHAAYQSPPPYSSTPSPASAFKSKNPFLALALEYEYMQRSREGQKRIPMSPSSPSITASNPRRLLLQSAEGAEISDVVAEDDSDEAWVDEPTDKQPGDRKSVALQVTEGRAQ